jgi:hypothetical protein
LKGNAGIIPPETAFKVVKNTPAKYLAGVFFYLTRAGRRFGIRYFAIGGFPTAVT